MTRGDILHGLSVAMNTRAVVVRGGKYDVVRDGLIIWYDAINNTGNGHSSETTQWYDLSGNGNHGTIFNGVWSSDELEFNGISTWVNCGRRDYTTMTLECLMTSDGEPTTWYEIADNYQFGGYGFTDYNGFYSFQVYKPDGYRLVQIGTSDIGVYKMLCGTADSSVILGYLNGQLSVRREYEGEISTPIENTVFALGVNPRGSTVDNPAEWLQGRIRVFRLYDRVLTAEEIRQNYLYDKRRYGL